ncbi:MAG: hypothetical protein VXY99_07685 [Pseudomonadota bacterium]|nr:hypothetical protein [Pseudomonadota bacterium]
MFTYTSGRSGRLGVMPEIWSDARFCGEGPLVSCRLGRPGGNFVVMSASSLEEAPATAEVERTPISRISDLENLGGYTLQLIARPLFLE